MYWPVLIACLLGAAPCLAQQTPQPGPLAQPSRDVEVVYEVSHAGAQLQERVRWQVQTGRQRVDAPNGGGFTVADRAAGTLSIVSPQAHRVVRLSLPADPLTGGRARFQKRGQQTIAGLACIDWQVSTPQNSGPDAVPTVVCLTADGVTLGMRTGDSQGARAVNVTYAPADPAAFVIPPDYQVVTPPQASSAAAP